MPTPQQPELARSGRSEATAEKSAKTRAGGPTTVEGPTGPVPEENLPGHHPEVDQDKPAVPPAARPRRTPAKAGAGARAKTAPAKRAPVRPAAAAGTDATTPAGSAAGATLATRRFPFAFEGRVLPFSALFGVFPGQAWVEVGQGELRVRFGPWSLRTSLANVEDTCITGPYSLAKVAGPARLSFTDRGATFATNTRRGVCIRFREPVPGAVPMALVRHPAVTVTVEDPDGLAEALADVAG